MSRTNAKIWAVVVVAACVGALVAPAPAAFAPSDVTGLRMWLDAGSLGLSDGADVTQWLGSHDFGNRIDGLTVGGQGTPTYVANGVNGLPSVRFNGSDDILRLHYDADPGSPLRWEHVIGGDGSAGVTMLAAVSPQGGNNAVLGDDNGVMTFAFINSANVLQGYKHAGSVVLDTSTSDLSKAVGAIRHTNAAANQANTGTAMLWDGAGTLSSATNDWTNSALGVGYFAYLGNRFPDPGDSPFNGDIAEVIVYGRALSDAELGQVGSYLASKYEVPEPATIALLAMGGLLVLRRR